MAKKAVFLDRNGTINVGKGDAHKPEHLEFIKEAIDGLDYLCREGYELVVVTNQSGIGRGKYTEQDYQKFIEHFKNELAKHNIKISGVYHCPHKPEDKCECRKPKTKLIKQAAKDLGIDLSQSYVVGNKASDIEMGLKAGCKKAFLIESSENLLEKILGAENVKDLFEAANRIITLDVGDEYLRK
jgi:D-glycero-D-manno-heptose 1,7-bisphosphate phosphatase